MGNVGFSFISSNYGDIMGTRVAQTEQGYIDTGYLDVGAIALGFSYARALTDKFTMGGQIKYASQRLGTNLLGNGVIVENKVSGLAYDFGTIFYPGFKSFRMGVIFEIFLRSLNISKPQFNFLLHFLLALLWMFWILWVKSIKTLC
jgi:hypothetical protein